MKSKTGILLMNLGSPEKPETGAVRAYLREFLSDPRVLDIHPALRFALLNLIILPFRSSHSAEAYKKIWMGKEGSPLLYHTRELTAHLSESIKKNSSEKFSVKYAMRYGNPSIINALREFRAEGIKKIRALPLYPHYAASTVGSSLAELYRSARLLWNVPELEILPPFFDDKGYLDALAASISNSRKRFEAMWGESPDHTLFSFHGIPERHIKKSDVHSHCLKGADCCESPGPALEYCYRAQCVQTAIGATERLGMDKNSYTVSFQSRMGRDRWIAPYTEDMLLKLPEKGVKNLLVVSPSFVSDCLETLEELDIRGREKFLDAGGSIFEYVPCLNLRPDWVETLGRLVLP